MKEFEDPLDTAVFTTKFVVWEGKTITRVSHDIDDGAWQFLSNDKHEYSIEDGMLLALKEIIEIDNSILEIADLPMGYTAMRETISGNWEIFKNTTE